MQMLGQVLSVIGLIIAVVGGIWLLVVAFQEGVWWGLGSMLCGLVGLYFVFTHWEDAKNPFLVNIAGAVLMGIGAALGGGNALGAAGMGM